MKNLYKKELKSGDERVNYRPQFTFIYVCIKKFELFNYEMI
jgi:hypothetical protein